MYFYVFYTILISVIIYNNNDVFVMYFIIFVHVPNSYILFFFFYIYVHFSQSKLKHQYYEIFYKVRKQFSNQNDADYTDVFNTNDQFLRNIALYLAENYNDAYAYCSTGKDCAEYCNYLNKWLNEKKSIYTSNGTCKLNDTLWKQYIEKLWNEIGNTKEKKDWCARKDDVINLPFPKDRHSSSCENTEYVNFSHTCDSAKDVQAIATGPPCTCPFQISTASSTFGYVLFAFLAIGIFLLNVKFHLLIKLFTIIDINVINCS